MRLGIFGGSFDPVHYGHLLLAECCREQCRLDRVWFMPAAEPPHKQGRPLTPPGQRVEMLQLAIAGHEAFEVSRIEIDRGGTSFTVDTLRSVHDSHPGAELFLLLGADMLRDLESWRSPEEVCRLAIPVFVGRPGGEPPSHDMLRPLMSPARFDECSRLRVEMPLIELSSTDLRARVGRGQSIRYRTPRAVEAYIEAQKLYR